ncbi:MAG: family 10 glycosylhydrolase [Verrucomicrobiales bacterium]|nr:family 10 glycosylhydrolase [Verrucomicrobiales bacterium]
MPQISITKARWLWNPLLSLAVAAALPGRAEEGWRPTPNATTPEVSEPVREFRGLWIATVYNLDWPSKPGLPVETQQAELREILDGAARLHFNAVVLQVRTMCDAFYDSPLEPWSYYLTGELGKAPEPHWDPLAFAVAEAHARGLELHAWFNPFRAATGTYGPVMPEDHITRQYPWLVRPVGRLLWLDPSSEFVRARIVTAVTDVVRRYDIDAVHMDDYFYPYPAKGAEATFDDEDNWTRYRLGAGLDRPEGPLSREDWRREIVNGLIRDLSREIHRTKPWVRLGISPFGIWRPGHPPGIDGMDAYDKIFADSRRWLQEGWVDYLSPQLYWKSGGPQSFTDLFRWWQDENPLGRHLWPGIASSRIGTGGEADGRGVNEIFSQIRQTRDYLGKSAGSGQLHWRWEAFASNRGGIRNLITREVYPDRAVPPPSPWLAPMDDPARSLPRAASISLAEAPVLDENGNETGRTEWRLTWMPADGPVSAARWWVVQTGRHEDGKPKGKTSPTWRTVAQRRGDDRLVALESLSDIDAFAIRAVDAYGRLGPVATFERGSADAAP